MTPLSLDGRPPSPKEQMPDVGWILGTVVWEEHMENRQATLDCPVCGARHSGLAATPARDARWPYRVECPVTCIQIPARFDDDGEATIGAVGGVAAPTARMRLG